MGLNEFPPQPREGLMTKQPPCAPWPAASFNQGIWHLPKLFGYEEQRRGFGRKVGKWLQRKVSEDEQTGRRIYNSRGRREEEVMVSLKTTVFFY